MQESLDLELKMELELQYFQITTLWQRFCEAHVLLYDLTCEEYSLLLKSNIDDLNDVLKNKEGLIKEIASLDSERQELIKTINTKLADDKKIQSVSDLLKFMQQYEIEQGKSFLAKFNLFLINVIEKIQDQNKRNQVFLNKAIHSLKGVKDNLAGRKNYQSYNAQGASVSLSTGPK